MHNKSPTDDEPCWLLPYPIQNHYCSHTHPRPSLSRFARSIVCPQYYYYTQWSEIRNLIYMTKSTLDMHVFGHVNVFQGSDARFYTFFRGNQVSRIECNILDEAGSTDHCVLLPLGGPLWLIARST
jgi:hypothetical protein